jgi:predicted HNH restriction endonuclease
MRRSKTAHERKSSRRRSWFHGSNIFTMFSSAPPSPDQTSLEETDDGLANRQRSQSLTPINTTATTPTSSIMSRNTLFRNNRSAFSDMLSKATHKKHRKESKDSSLYDDNSSSMRRSSDATTVSETFPQQYYLNQKLFKTDEEEADRIQLKNDLVKLAFEG